MRKRKKPLHQQTLVVTGASSGIGLATARLAARRGARVVLSSFDERALVQATEALRREGGAVSHFMADVADFDAVQGLADHAARTFGGIDTWVGNAGVHIFGTVREVGEVDARRVFDVNHWGVVHGSRAAIPWLRRSGGTLITVGSVLASRSVPLQGIYTASKHAVKAWSDALRMELAMEGADVAVCLVAPAAIHTPIDRHSRSLMPHRVQLPPPMYHPAIVARTLLRLAVHPKRDVVVGGAGVFAGIGEKWAPQTADEVMLRAMFRLQRAYGPPRGVDALHRPLGEAPRTRSIEPRLVLRRSTWTWAQLHPALAATAALGGAAVVAGLRARFS